MADTNKEIAAILAEMRCDNQLANSLTASQLSAFLRYADRIEAAVKREIAQWRGETNAAKEERNRIACKMRYEFAAKCRACKSAHGNAAAMREALKESTALLAVVRGDEYAENITRQIDRNTDVLSAPARNCDRYATLDEARKAFQEARGHKVLADVELWDSMDEAGALVRWLFAPAEGVAE